MPWQKKVRGKLSKKRYGTGTVPYLPDETKSTGYSKNFWSGQADAYRPKLSRIYITYLGVRTSIAAASGSMPCHGKKKVRGELSKKRYGTGTVPVPSRRNKKYRVPEKFLVGKGCRVSTEAVAYLHNVPLSTCIFHSRTAGTAACIYYMLSMLRVPLDLLLLPIMPVPIECLVLSSSANVS